MDEVWERAIDYACGGEDPSLVRSLTLDGSVKGPPGRLPPRALFEQFSQLRILSIANVNLISLTGFPSLPLLERLILSDNRICGGLEVLVEARLVSLRDLDLSNNKIQCLSDLNPLAKLNLLSLDLYKCPVTRIPDYRSKVFSLIRSLQYLDKVDTENNERPEFDEEEDDEDDDELAEDEDEGGKSGRVVSSTGVEDEDESNEEKDIQDDYDDSNSGESDELSEDDDDGVQYHAMENHEVHRKEVSGSEEVDDDDDDDDSDDEDNDDEIEVQEIEEDAGEDDGEEDDEDREDDKGMNHVGSSRNGDINAQDEYEGGGMGGDNEDEDGEGDEDDEDEEEDRGNEYLVQPIAKAEEEEASDFWPGEYEDEDEEIDDDPEDQLPVPSMKRKRSKDDSEDDERPPKQ